MVPRHRRGRRPSTVDQKRHKWSKVTALFWLKPRIKEDIRGPSLPLTHEIITHSPGHPTHHTNTQTHTACPPTHLPRRAQLASRGAAQPRGLRGRGPRDLWSHSGAEPWPLRPLRFGSSDTVAETGRRRASSASSVPRPVRKTRDVVSHRPGRSEDV